MDVFARICGLTVIAGILGFLWWYSHKSHSISFGPLKFGLRKVERGSSSAPYIAVVARSRINATHELHLVEALGQHILICTTPSNAAVLSTRERADRSQDASA